MSSTGLKKSIVSRSLLTVVEFVSALISFPYAARVLSPAGLGQVDFANSAVAYFVTIGAFGIAEYGAREVGRSKGDPGKAASFISGIEFFRLLLSLALFLVYIGVVVPFFGGGTVLFLISSSVVLSSALNMIWALEIFEDFTFITWARLVSKIGFIGSLFLWVKEPKDVTVYFVLMILSDLAFYLCSIFRLNMKFHVPFRSGIKNLTIVDRKLLRGLLNVFTLNILQSSIAGVPALTLGKLGAFHELGIFSSAYRILMMGFYALVPLTSVFFVRSMALSAAEGKEERERNFEVNANILLMISIPVAFGIFSISSDLIHLLVGEQYVESIPVLRCLSFLIVIFSFINFWGMQVAFGFGKEKSLVFANFWGLLLMILLILYFAPRYGAVGTAWAYVAGYFFIFCVSYLIGRKFCDLSKVRSDGIRSLVAGASMLGALYVIPNNGFLMLAVKVGVGVVVYFGVLLLLRHSLLMNLIRRKLQ